MKAALSGSAVLTACLLLNVAQGQDPALSAKTLLDRHLIRPTTEDIQKFLASLNPEHEANQSIRDLILQLGAARYAERESATQKLIELPIVPETCLAEAEASADSEVRDRADHVLRRAKGTPQREVTQAVFQVICDQRIKGLVGAVLDAQSWIDDAKSRAMIADVLAATVVAEDANRLKACFQEADPSTRAMLAGALAIALGSQTPEAIHPLLAESDPTIQLIVARTLLTSGDRKALRVMAGLLNAEDAEIRAQAIAILQAVTGQQLGFVAYKSIDERRESLSRWVEWVKLHGDSAELKLPLKLMPPLRGRITVCLPDANRVIELNLQGQFVEELTNVESPKGCQRQPNGNWLFASYKGRFIAEYDTAGRRIWQLGLPQMPDLKGPMRVTRLSNGNFLVPFLDSMTVAEVDPKGKLVWQVKNNHWPMDAKRLENGNTLISAWEYGVVEYDASGQIVWQIDGLKAQRPGSAQRLPNGNTIVCLNKAGRVEEFDPAGRSVWSVSVQNPRDAQRLADGSTIISEAMGVRRIDQDGVLLWQYPIAGTAGMRVY